MSKTAAASGMERRRGKRRALLESFSLFVVVPSKGVHRLPVHDVSESGIGFSIDIPGELETDFAVKTGDAVALRLYLNQTLYIPLKVKVARLTTLAAGDGEPTVRRVGGEFTDPESAAYKGLAAFLQMLDQISEAATIESASASI